MKLTDEQREEIKRTRDFPYPQLKYETLQTLVDSEQEWKAEALKQRELNDVLANDNMNAKLKLQHINGLLEQAVEVLKWYANKENYKLQNADVYDSGGFAEYNVLGDDGDKAREFLSQQEVKS